MALVLLYHVDVSGVRGGHLDAATTQPGPCVFGDPSSATTVVLFGDSHAAEWFPAVERLAIDRDWRLVSLTKSACSSADLTIWSQTYKRPYTECDTWRAAAFARIAMEHPALVIVTNSGRFEAVVDGQPTATNAREDLWFAGLTRTLSRLAGTSDAVVLIGETPRSATDPPVCLSAHLDNATACATDFSEAVDRGMLAGDARVAAAAGATFIDPTAWICSSDPCPVIIGRLLIYRDEHHLTATYARALAPRLLPLLPVP